MTTKDSICVRCAVLLAYTNAYTGSKEDNNIALISECAYGGKNAGNREKCKTFKEASEDTIKRRMRVFEGEIF